MIAEQSFHQHFIVHGREGQNPPGTGVRGQPTAMNMQHVTVDFAMRVLTGVVPDTEMSEKR